MGADDGDIPVGVRPKKIIKLLSNIFFKISGSLSFSIKYYLNDLFFKFQTSNKILGKNKNSVGPVFSLASGLNVIHLYDEIY